MNLATRCLGVSAGLMADRVWGEPPLHPHPVALFGSAMTALERAMFRDKRAAGVAYALIGMGVAAAIGKVICLTPVATYLAVAGRGLGEAAESVHEAVLVGDIEEARLRVKALVGRDTTELHEDEVVRAVVESLAENTVDAVVAPAMWAAVAGAPGVFAYRACNTLDAMVGHRSSRYARFGWASARLDDVAAWLPARVTAVLVVVVRPRCASAVLRAVRSDAPSHPSPNSGVAEAAFAAALGVSLGGESSYEDRIEVRPILGTGPAPRVVDIYRAKRLSRDVSLALAAIFALVPMTRWLMRSSP